MIIQLAVNHFLGRGDDGLADGLVQPTQRHIGFGGGALDDAQRPHDGQGLFLPADLEIAQAALGLGAPIAVGSDFDRAEGVGLSATGHDALLLAE